MLQGSDLLKTINNNTKELSGEEKCPHFATKFKLYEKPQNPREHFTDEEWETAVSKFQKLKKNKFVPEETSTIASSADDSVDRNTIPKKIEFKENEIQDLRDAFIRF